MNLAFNNTNKCMLYLYDNVCTAVFIFHLHAAQIGILCLL